MLTKLSEAIRKKPIIGWGLFLAVMVRSLQPAGLVKVPMYPV